MPDGYLLGVYSLGGAKERLGAQQHDRSVDFLQWSWLSNSVSSEHEAEAKRRRGESLVSRSPQKFDKIERYN